MASSAIATTLTTLEELPYFPERYPGKVCSLCNLCERSALGQGDMLKIPINLESLKSLINALSDTLNSSFEDDVLGRKKSVAKSRVTLNNEVVNELDVVGHAEIPSLESLVFDERFLYVHRMCAMWSLQLKRIDEDFLPKFGETVVKSIQRRCNFCLHYGASINCRMSCQRNYHLPCAAASGCFLIIETFQAFCIEHVIQVPYIAIGENIECRNCFNLGDISKLLMCSTCGAHYHTNCVGLANLPDSRSGWNCQQCCKCLICRESEGTDRSVKCEQCQKIYHTNCLRPTISSIPKYGWKCNRCRICSDCGARTPGAGSSSRWHLFYTICDSCYQQRNKGFSCPICMKAYRSAHKEMVKCNNCNRFVHGSCDGEADINAYHKKKETNPDYDYLCPPCKSGKNAPCTSLLDPISIVDAFPRDLESEFYDKDPIEVPNMVDPLKISKKRIGFKELSRGGKVGKLSLGKGGILNPISRKRSARGRGRQLLMLNSSLQSSTSSDLNNTQCSEEDSLEKRIVLCSAKDKFVLMQDICVMCGTLGTDKEACLIACVQCGQCYHPHCASVTVSKTMLQKGWRCLDCTVCEGCGQKNDEARLILCDECDISYHIYCVGLDAVPNGHWKCKLCALCQKCGRSSPGKNSNWLNGVLECGPCASQSKCSQCAQPYNENELIIQCSSCEIWLHCLCDNIKNEDEAKLYNEQDYHCKMCRKENNPPKSAISNKTSSENHANKAQSSSQPQTTVGSSQENITPNISKPTATPTNETLETPENIFWIDGVCVSEQGFNMIRSLTTEIKKKRKLKADIAQKDATIMSSIDSVVSGNLAGNTGEGGLDGHTASATPTIYKDGMIWQGEEGSQPEGFSISTNDEGVSILRKKRQRNLQKLGIGGFNVRMRGIRKESEELYMGSLENPSLTDEKKKKIIKKKLKSKLCESYPSYLQEAFFGKTLLDSKESITFAESDSSDEYSKSQTLSYILPENPIIKTENTSQVISQKSTEKNVCDAEQNDSSQGLQMRTLLSSNNSHIDETTLKTIKTENVITKIVPENFNMSSNSNMGMVSAVKMEISNPITQQNIMQNNMNMNNTGQQMPPQKLMQYQNYDPVGMKNKNVTQYLTQKSEDPMLLSQVKIEREVVLAQTVNTSERILKDSVEAPIPVEEPVKETGVAGTQKTAEKMRKDEDLGEMATISAVLYANTQHPELKTLYPNWNERCKQILKKWRSLSTEMKAPFLQHAKDNRSFLRLRRTQQDDTTYFQQKSLKEQEQERVWKQHQAKNKETYSTKFNKTGFINDFGRPESLTTPPIGQKQQQLQPQQQQSQTMFDMNLLNDNSQNKIHKSGLIPTDQMSSIDGNQLTDSNKALSQLDQSQQSLFMDTLNQIQSQSQQSTMDDLSKAFEPNKPDHGLQLADRNDIFLSEKNWTGVPKLSDANKDSLNSGTEKLEADENAGFGDILGGFGEGDDDDILKSLTAEIGDDFNILEYADPELDEINGSQNLLSKLDFDENQKTI